MIADALHRLQEMATDLAHREHRIAISLPPSAQRGHVGAFATCPQADCALVRDESVLATLQGVQEPLEQVYVAEVHGGNIGGDGIPFYLYRGQRSPEYDQGDCVVVWYDDLYDLDQKTRAAVEARVPHEPPAQLLPAGHRELLQIAVKNERDRGDMHPEVAEVLLHTIRKISEAQASRPAPPLDWREKLREFGQHKEGCACVGIVGADLVRRYKRKGWLWQQLEPLSCDCGLDELFTNPPAAVPQAAQE